MSSLIPVSKGITVNLGDYESQRIDATLWYEPNKLDAETDLQQVERLHRLIDAYLIGAIQRAAVARGKTRWSRELIAKRFGLVDTDQSETGVAEDGDME